MIINSNLKEIKNVLDKIINPILDTYKETDSYSIFMDKTNSINEELCINILSIMDNFVDNHLHENINNNKLINIYFINSKYKIKYNLGVFESKSDDNIKLAEAIDKYISEKGYVIYNNKYIKVVSK